MKPCEPQEQHPKGKSLTKVLKRQEDAAETERSDRDRKASVPGHGQCQIQDQVALSTSTDTPGPMVELSAIFFM